MGDIDARPIWEELLKRAIEVRNENNKEDVDAVIKFIRSCLGDVKT